MEWTRAKVRLLSFLVFGTSCGLIAVDAPASGLSITAAIVSLLVLLASFASDSEESPGVALSDLKACYGLSDDDVLTEYVQDGSLFVDETSVTFVPGGEREPSWSVPLASVTRVTLERRVLDYISVRYESPSGDQDEKEVSA